MSRENYKIQRDSYEYVRSERVDWLDNFAEKYQPKSAVEVARQRGQYSIQEQINSIINNKPNYATVESAVEDLRKRVGLTDYLNQVSAAREKTAEYKFSTFDKFGPKMKDDIIAFCKNKIKTHRGQITVPAVQHDVLSLFKQHGLQPQDVNNDEIARCISQLILDEVKINPPQDTNNATLGLGVGTDVDKNEENNDFFKGMMPDVG